MPTATVTPLPVAERRAQRAAAPLRFVTATGLFDGHDASINIMRRILQASGAEVIHLGHNRSVEEIVSAAIQEDARAVAVSSYQGGHLEYFKYMVDMLAGRGRPDIHVFGGGGGVIVPSEIKQLESGGVTRIYSPEDGRELGLQGMVDDMMRRCAGDAAAAGQPLAWPACDNWPVCGDWAALARAITALENGAVDERTLGRLRDQARAAPPPAPVLGITGTGGSGKSSLTDELVLRFRMDYSDTIRIAIVALDPSRRRSGGALLGDRIRMNAIAAPGIYMRSLATREARGGIPQCLDDVIALIRLSGVDLVILETPGMGQGDSSLVERVTRSLYVMTPEFGAASQLEKIDMLDFADVVVINKFDRPGAEDALRDVRKQVRRNREAFTSTPARMPVYGATAARFNDAGVTALYAALVALLEQDGLAASPRQLHAAGAAPQASGEALIAPSRRRYLGEIAQTVRDYKEEARRMAEVARRCGHLRAAAAVLTGRGADTAELGAALAAGEAELEPRCRELLGGWPALAQRYREDELEMRVQGSEVRAPLWETSLSGSRVPRVALPRYSDDGDLLQWLLLENLPGHFPFTAGVFPLKRRDEEPTRMFAGEGDPFKTNKRFHYLSRNSGTKRLSTAFDSVTLYGCDPERRPDIYGKVGNSGVSVATLDDMKALYRGFDLCDPGTSVSMTINGPAPTILAMFLNTAIDQRLDAFRERHGHDPGAAEVEQQRAAALERVRGTVQADILKEDQGQNTCIFSTGFSLRLMGDIQEYFIRHRVRNFYSASISGYHIAEAGANPITQLAFTLANGFTYVESYLARGMDVDDFAPSLSFFFSNGMDPEYSVMGRVARRIWALTMRNRYGAGERGCKLKYHVQTSGRSLHAREMDFNDIRTTLQALIAVYDNCNSLHTNAHDEAVTTPTEESVRRAMAVQLIINREWGLARTDNSLQGSFVVDELTELVEEAVLGEFERLSVRGGVLGAMESGYQRGRIQDESMYYEQGKHDGSLPVIGINTFLNPRAADPGEIELRRSSEREKQGQIERLREFNKRHEQHAGEALARLRRAAINGDNVFAELMHTVRHCSLGSITEALFAVGGKYRRNM